MKKLEKKRLKNIIVSVIAIILVLLVIISINNIQQTRESEKISSFQECLNRGHLVMESNPRQCRTSSGEIFLEENKDTLNFIEITNALRNPAFQERKEFILESKESFKDIFQDNPLYIDFSKTTVLAVFSGTRSTGGYSTQIRRIERIDGSLNVFVQEISPGNNCMVTQAITYPFTAVEISKTEKQINFVYEEGVRNC